MTIFSPERFSGDVAAGIKVLQGGIVFLAGGV